jgi:hypothetical protein
MSLVNKISARVRREFFRWQFARTSRHVLATPPLERGRLPFLLLSMVQKRDVQSYLLAVKSFACHANPERIVIVCDPSLNDSDRALLTQHVPHAELHTADTFTHACIPRGGTWERLFAISDFVRDNYVVQLDADTLTLQPIPEVLHAVRDAHGFVLGEKSDTSLLPLAVTYENALPFLGPGEHIQDISEASMVALGLPEQARYVRGCSGFTGFPRSHEMRDRMIDFSQRMGGKLGAKWARWGTEQVTSNYLVANATGTVVLPFPKYGTPDLATKDTAFFHFIGSMRHVDNQYTAATRQALRLIFNRAA